MWWPFLRDRISGRGFIIALPVALVGLLISGSVPLLGFIIAVPAVTYVLACLFVWFIKD